MINKNSQNNETVLDQEQLNEVNYSSVTLYWYMANAFKCVIDINDQLSDISDKKLEVFCLTKRNKE